MSTDAQPPADGSHAATSVLEEALGFLFSAALRTAVKLGIAEELSAGPRSIAELAGATGADSEYLQRTLRLLATRSVFAEDADGEFHLTERAATLHPDSAHSVAAAVLAATEPFIWTPAANLERGVRTGRPPFEEAYGKPFFQHLGENPRDSELFNAGVAAFAPGADELFATEYDFPATGVVIDVGGGIGGMLLETLRQNPGLRGVLFDLPAALEEHVLGELGEPDRWELASGDFFEAVPRGGDIYALRYITHDWDDQRCVRILRNCRDAMSDGGRVLVVDTVLPAGNVAHTGKTVDVLMMIGLPGRERTEPEIERLFTEAGLRLTRIIPIGPTLSILEGVA